MPQKSPYRFVVMDFDNTLIDANLILSPRVKAAILKAIEQGNVLTIATGRGPLPVWPFVEELGLNAPVIYMQGGYIYDHSRNLVLQEQCISPEDVARVISAARKNGWNLIFADPDALYLAHDMEYEAPVLENIRQYGVRWIGTFQNINNPNKFMVAVDQPHKRETLLQQMNNEFAYSGSRISVVPSHPLLIEGVPSMVHKGNAVAWLAERLGFSSEQCIAIGDNDNDIEMIAWAGLGIAMGDATPKAKAAAKAVVPTVKEDGVAIALETWLLNKE